MRLATVQRGQKEIAAVVLEGDAGPGALPVDELERLSGLRFPRDLLTIIREQLFPHLLQAAEAAAGRTGLPLIPLGQARFAPPYRHPAKIWGIGLNYREHAADLDEEAPQNEPGTFFKPATAIIGPGEPIRLPPVSNKVTAEAELGLIIGRTARDVSPEEVPGIVFGYTLVIDMTAEDILRRNPRFLTRAKSFDTFFSFGPWIVTADEVTDPLSLRVETVHNGRIAAQNAVANMIHRPWEIVAYLSQSTTLLPGDIISTGTPGAVPIRPGDTVGCRISGLGELTNPVAGPAPGTSHKEGPPAAERGAS
ncbi:MAG: fumarylacetoacetate hydrolase family protein [Firmicutes bacterium]|nr:fumarylacetoacetate hydrolase family protein [Bacillota bacterium]